jgi:hypothetical protein
MAEQIIELADVFRVGFREYAAQHAPLPAQHYKVVNALLSCHTSLLGGHIYRCEECGHEKISYNSCRNRHCPSCQGTARAQWVDNRMKELLPVPYFHVVFTIPSELNPFALRNKKAFYNILFKAASETLLTLAEDPKYLGAAIGFFAILHTWGQNLLDHPHLHCVVPAGGLAADGSRWKKIPYGKFLFPVKVMSALFRGKFLDFFKAAVRDKEILFHGVLEKYQDHGEFRALLDTLYNNPWVVYAKPPFAGPNAVLKYLGHYTHRIAIANSRLVDITDTHVSFKWKDAVRSAARGGSSRIVKFCVRNERNNYPLLPDFSVIKKGNLSGLPPKAQKWRGQESRPGRAIVFFAKSTFLRSRYDLFYQQYSPFHTLTPFSILLHASNSGHNRPIENP